MRLSAQDKLRRGKTCVSDIPFLDKIGQKSTLLVPSVKHSWVANSIFHYPFETWVHSCASFLPQEEIVWDVTFAIFYQICLSWLFIGYIPLSKIAPRRYCCSILPYPEAQHLSTIFAQNFRTWAPYLRHSLPRSTDPQKRISPIVNPKRRAWVPCIAGLHPILEASGTIFSFCLSDCWWKNTFAMYF